MHDGHVRRGIGRGTPRGWFVRTLLSLGVILVVTVPGTRAAWVDPAAVGGASIQAGTVDLKVQGSDAVTGYTALNLSTMEPGDSTAGLLTVRNSGTARLYFRVDANTTNADGKGLAGTLLATVTGDSSVTGSAPTATCAGAALAGTGSTFGTNLIGSAASPRSLAAGNSETFCIQARLPNGASAIGAATTIGFTFQATTGTGAAVGWSDSVAVSGTSLSTLNGFYLGTSSAGNTTSTSSLPLRRTGPTLTTLFNYDTDRDSAAGLLLKSSGPPGGRSQVWNMSVGASPLTISGSASVRLWSAMTGFDATKVGSLEVALLDCDSTATTCTQVSASTITSSGSWSGGSGTWVSRTWTLGTGSYTYAANRVVQVKVSTTNGTSDDMMVAYDTTTYRSAMLITP